MTPSFCKFRKILDKNGIPFVIDDFGTGYSNLHCIRDMNPSYVKMDRDFTAKAMNSDRDYELYKNIIPMVHSINVRICAEGIEEKEWLLKMKEMKVDYLQGYYFGRPCGKKQFLQQYVSGINESKADSAMRGCLILWSYQKDGSITASFSFSKSLASG